MAWHDGKFSLHTFVWALLLAVSIQILSNLANDLGDYEKGTDTSGKRQGPPRATQSGKITPERMKTAIGVFTLLTLALGITLTLTANVHIGWIGLTVLLATGLLGILAALFYTLGKHAYGYRGWGDFFAFLFFGPVPVIGTYFLHTGSLDFHPVLPAVGLGLISAMTLNINNMRDIDNDRASGKKTIVVWLGLQNARFYHTLLTFGMFTCFIGYSYIYEPASWYRYLYVVVFLFQFHILTQVRKKTGRELDPYLRLTSASGFLLAVIFSICITV